jgi:hypothetical protein
LKRIEKESNEREREREKELFDPTKTWKTKKILFWKILNFFIKIIIHWIKYWTSSSSCNSSLAYGKFKLQTKHNN